MAADVKVYATIFSLYPYAFLQPDLLASHLHRLAFLTGAW